MNLGAVWDELSTQERKCIHRAILYYNFNTKNRYSEIPKHHKIEFNKIPFLELNYVMRCVIYYRKNTSQKLLEALKIKNLIKKLKGLKS